MKNLITTLDFAAQEKALVMELEILQLSGESHWKLYFFFFLLPVLAYKASLNQTLYVKPAKVGF